MTSTLSTGFDFTDPDLNMARIPHDEFAALRRSQPIFWVEQAPEARAGMSDASGSGYWAVTKHADILTVSKNSQIFSSRENGVIIRLPATATRESLEMTKVVIINQDAPDHTQLRSIISRGFTPRAAACPVTRFRPRGVGRFDLGFLGMGSSFRGRATQSARSLAFLLRLRGADRRLHMLLLLRWREHGRQAERFEP
jgi:hypothetical protein